MSCNASCGPDRNGRDAHLLGNRQFDEGFHADLLDGGTAEALDDVRHQALIARKEVSDDATQAEEG
ncbi:MAG: hypothetical protein JO051_03340 [Acidobacteriaceae bacterium]|nr:hypothetical protein [Acidobacteriaceae bacterium]